MPFLGNAILFELIGVCGNVVTVSRPLQFSQNLLQRISGVSVVESNYILCHEATWLEMIQGLNAIRIKFSEFPLEPLAFADIAEIIAGKSKSERINWIETIKIESFNVGTFNDVWIVRAKVLGKGLTGIRMGIIRPCMTEPPIGVGCFNFGTRSAKAKPAWPAE